MTGHVERRRAAWPNPLWSLLPAASALGFGLAIGGIDPLPIAIHAAAAAGAWWIGRALQVDYGHALVTGLLFATTPLARAALVPETALPLGALFLLPGGVALWSALRNPTVTPGEAANRRRLLCALVGVGVTACALVVVLAARALGAPFPSTLVHVAALGPALLVGQLLAAMARRGALRPLRSALAATLTLAAMVAGLWLARGG